MADSPRIPNLTDISLLPPWAKELFLLRCGARLIPRDLQQIGMAGANADASARLGREVPVGADPLPRLLEFIEKVEQQGNMAGYGLGVCDITAGLPQVECAENATSLVGQALEQMIQAYAASRLNEGAVVGSVWFDFAALRDASQASGWTDVTPIGQSDLLSDLWPNGPPPGWPNG